MRHFVFLEFLDPLVISTLRELRSAFQSNISQSSPVHITLRGPYRNEPDQATLRDLSEKLCGQGVRIIGCGIFAVSGGYSVFLRAESAAFRELWWKPDYKTSLDNIQPHLTMYQAASRSDALLVLNFLRAAKINILAYSVQLTVFSTGQNDLFGTKPISIKAAQNIQRRDIVAVDPEVLVAAKELGTRLARRGRV